MVSRESDRAAAARFQLEHLLRGTMSKKSADAMEVRGPASYVEGRRREGPTDAAVALRITAANRGRTVLRN